MAGVKFHFLNVGAGDCTIIHFPERVIKDKDGKTIKEKSERIMMVDFCHHEDHDEYEHVLNYYKKNFQGSNGKPKTIFRYICTHPHHDHICGLHKLFDDADISICNFRCVDHKFEPDSFDGHARHQDDRKTYKNPKDKSGCTILNYTRDSKQSEFWGDEEDRITILSPSKSMIDDVHKDSEGNEKESSSIDIDHISYALMIEINSIRIVLGGDSRLSAREDIQQHFGKKVENIKILKAPHHGHYSAFEKKIGEDSEFVQDIVKHMNPEYIIFSNSKEEDEKYGAETEYQKACPNARILKTHNGSIVIECSFDGTIIVS